MKKGLVLLLAMAFVFCMAGMTWAFTYDGALTDAGPGIWENPPNLANGTFAYHFYGIPSDLNGQYNMQTTSSDFVTYLYLYDRLIDEGNLPASDFLVYGLGESGITWELTSPKTYYLVTTSEQAFTEGTFTNAINPVVPVPGAVWLFGSGLIGLLGFRRKLLEK